MIDLNQKESKQETEQNEPSEQSWRQSLYPLKKIPKNLWKFDLVDKNVFIYLIAIEALCWFIGISNGSIYSALLVYDGPFYTYAAKTMYNIPDDWLFAETNNMRPEYMACHFPGYPIIIRICSMLCFKNYVLGSLLAIILTSYFSIYIFRRFLIVYDLVNDPDITTYLSICIPLRLLNYRVVGASEPLYIICIFSAMIFFKTNQFILLLLSLFGATITRIEGLSIVGTIGLCYLLRLDIIRAVLCSIGALGTVGVFYMHYICFHNVHAYFDHNQGYKRLLDLPFIDYMYLSTDYSMFPMLYQKFFMHAILLIPLFTIWNKSIPLCIFILTYFIYMAAIQHPDIFRYGSPAYLPSLLIGFDCIVSLPIIKNKIKQIMLTYTIFSVFYIFGQINSNIMGKEVYAQIVNNSRPY